MTTEPVILPPDATVADALAHVRNAELSPSLAALVYVARPPLEPPTGRLLGVAHIQRLLREPPSTMVGHVLDTDIEPLRPTLQPRGLRPAPRDVQPGRGAGRRRGRPAARRGDRRRPARPPAARELAGHPEPDRRTGADRRHERWRPWIGHAARDRRPRRPARATRAPARRTQGHPAADRPPPAASTPTRSAGSRRTFARFMGTARFLIYMTLFVAVWLLWNWLAPGPIRVRRLPVHLPDPDAQPAGVVRRAADPARAEPAGGPGPGDRRAGPAARTPARTPTWSSWPARWPRSGWRSARSRPATTSAPSCAR